MKKIVNSPAKHDPIKTGNMNRTINQRNNKKPIRILTKSISYVNLHDSINELKRRVSESDNIKDEDKKEILEAISNAIRRRIFVSPTVTKKRYTMSKKTIEFLSEGKEVLKTENTRTIYNKDRTTYVYITPESVRCRSECE